jgi:hypothetical protein
MFLFLLGGLQLLFTPESNDPRPDRQAPRSFCGAPAGRGLGRRETRSYDDHVARAKQVSGVAVAMELYGLAEELVRARLRRDHPRRSAAAIEAAVNAWRIARPGAEHGDCPGRRLRWPLRRR